MVPLTQAAPRRWNARGHDPRRCPVSRQKGSAAGPAIDGQGSPQNVFSCKVDRERDHIAQKPAKVMRWIMQVVPRRAIVLDPFMGTGSTLEAARDLGHRAIGIDVDERYCERAAKRFDQGVLPLEAVA